MQRVSLVSAPAGDICSWYRLTGHSVSCRVTAAAYCVPTAAMASAGAGGGAGSGSQAPASDSDKPLFTYHDSESFADDLALLGPGKWLNDRVIAFYGE